MFRKCRKHKSHVEVPDDTGEAQVIRAQAREEREKLQGQAPIIEAIATRLIRRRYQNYFGEEIQITFRPRGSRA